MKTENLIYTLDTIASMEATEIESDAFEVVWENEQGMECWADHSITAVAKEAAEVLRAQDVALKQAALNVDQLYRLKSACVQMGIATPECMEELGCTQGRHVMEVIDGLCEVFKQVSSYHKQSQELAANLWDANQQIGVMACALRNLREFAADFVWDDDDRNTLFSAVDEALSGKLPTNPVTVTETIRTAPERIWLQVGDQPSDSDYPFPERHDEVSWCADSVMACEVPYVRADLASKLPAPVVLEGVVTVGPTEAMLDAIRSSALAERCYRAMLSAIPKSNIDAK